MTLDAATTLAVILLVMVLLIATRRPPGVVLLAGVSLLTVIGILTPKQAIAGLSNEGVVTIVLLFAVTAGLKATGSMGWISKGLLGRPKSLLMAQWRMMLPVGIFSAFMNNTPLVAILLPAVHDWARQNHFSISKLLIPLSFASILGGACTLVGTSTNLIINGWLIDELNHPGLGMFELAWVGVPCAVLGLAFILLTGKWLLPDRQPPVSIKDDLRTYTAEVIVEKGGAMAGKTVEQAGLRNLPGVFLMEIDRRGETLPAIGPTERLQDDDRLVFVGVVESVIDLHKLSGLLPAPDQVFKLDAPRSTRILIEAVVSNSCPLIGRSIRQGRFRTHYDAVVIAVARSGRKIAGRLGDVRLRPGDTLLLEALPSFIDQQRDSRDFFLVSKVSDSHPPNHAKAPIALAILAAMVLVVAMGGLSMFKAALLAVGLMLVTGCCTTNAIRQAIDGQVYVAIAASMGLGKAMQVSGLDQNLVQPMLALADRDPLTTLALLYGLSMCLAGMISAKAAAVLMLPLAFAAATDLQVSYLPMVMAVLFSCSMTLATPIGYPTNLMIYGPGGYRFGDYLRMGLPLSLLLWGLCIGLIPMVWPFYSP